MKSPGASDESLIYLDKRADLHSSRLRRELIEIPRTRSRILHPALSGPDKSRVFPSKVTRSVAIVARYLAGYSRKPGIVRTFAPVARFAKFISRANDRISDSSADKSRGDKRRYRQNLVFVYACRHFLGRNFAADPPSFSPRARARARNFLLYHLGYISSEPSELRSRPARKSINTDRRGGGILRNESGSFPRTHTHTHTYTVPEFRLLLSCSLPSSVWLL